MHMPCQVVLVRTVSGLGLLGFQCWLVTRVCLCPACVVMCALADQTCFFALSLWLMLPARAGCGAASA